MKHRTAHIMNRKCVHENATLCRRCGGEKSALHHRLLSHLAFLLLSRISWKIFLEKRFFSISFSSNWMGNSFWQPHHFSNHMWKEIYRLCTMVHNAFASKIHQLKKIKTKLLKGNKKILKKREKDLGFNFFFFFFTNGASLQFFFCQLRHSLNTMYLGNTKTRKNVFNFVVCEAVNRRVCLSVTQQ